MGRVTVVEEFLHRVRGNTLAFDEVIVRTDVVFANGNKLTSEVAKINAQG